MKLRLLALLLITLKGSPRFLPWIIAASYYPSKYSFMARALGAYVVRQRRLLLSCLCLHSSYLSSARNHTSPSCPHHLAPIHRQSLPVVFAWQKCHDGGLRVVQNPSYPNPFAHTPSCRIQIVRRSLVGSAHSQSSTSSTFAGGGTGRPPPRPPLGPACGGSRGRPSASPLRSADPLRSVCCQPSSNASRKDPPWGGPAPRSYVSTPVPALTLSPGPSLPYAAPPHDAGWLPSEKLLYTLPSS
mmetsp:Transcript_25743/g.55905  ORF Transcript_25743/g.55905 Transcript_25743/m.55905 type:complete len:243 (-) Transcript_25743:877-1605(-)